MVPKARRVFRVSCNFDGQRSEGTAVQSFKLVGRLEILFKIKSVLV